MNTPDGARKGAETKREKDPDWFKKFAAAGGRASKNSGFGINTDAKLAGIKGAAMRKWKRADLDPKDFPQDPAGYMEVAKWTKK